MVEATVCSDSNNVQYIYNSYNFKIQGINFIYQRETDVKVLFEVGWADFCDVVYCVAYSCPFSVRYTMCDVT